MAEGGASLTAAVHIEAISKDGHSEAAWAKAVSASAPLPIYLVAYADLSLPDAAEHLQRLRTEHGTEVCVSTSAPPPLVRIHMRVCMCVIPACPHPVCLHCVIRMGICVLKAVHCVVRVRICVLKAVQCVVHV